MKAWLNAHWFAFTGTVRRMLQTPASTLLNGLVLGIALALPLLGYSVLVSLTPITRDLAADPEITVFMKPTATREQAQAALTQIKQQAANKADRVELVTREKALEDLKAQPAYSDVLGALPNNPFPDAIVVRLKNSEEVAALSTQLQQSFSTLPHVQFVQIDSAWVKRLEAGLRFVQRGLLLLAGAFAVAVIAVVFNTIRLQVLTKQDEIAVSQLVGATAAFVARPFYYLGMLYGLLAGLMALLLVWSSLFVLNAAVADLARTYGSTFGLAMPTRIDLALFLAASLLLGWIGSVLSVARHLRLN